jgi:hypothetical protein
MAKADEEVAASRRALGMIVGFALAGVLVVIATVHLLGQSAKGPYDDERPQWSLMCAAIAGPPSPTLDDEFSGQRSAQSQSLFDHYLLKEPVDEFPSPIRADMVTLRQADLDYRAGKLTGVEARVAGAAGERALSDQHFNGACSWFRRQGS